ncbi:MAG TPA: Gfo/Idh/MocA family oxidoreductase [Solirubrobacteraceae bacterium]|jgi:predicted dehydrogenase|nr:Gfo/Idh/MocA family oxidoreductase [Solirubrobacteraceae bacterium]
MPERAVAIIGYGVAGRVFHGPLIAATEGLRVAAIVTRDPERRREAAQDHPAAAIYDTPEDLWEDAGKLDAVVIAAPNDAHAPLASAAIDLGLAVVVDKPLALNSGEATQLLDHAERAGALLTVFQNRRWDSDQLTLAALLAEGSLGNILRYESRFERWRPEPQQDAWRERNTPEQGGGLLLDLGSHLVDQALHLFGPAESIYAEIDNRRGLPADDDDFLVLTHSSGVISHLHASALTAAPGPRLRVLGTEAALLVRDLDSQEDRLRAGQRPDTVADWGVEPEHSRPRLIAGERSVPLRGQPGDWPRFYALFAAAIAGEGPPPVDPRDAVQTLRVLEAARRSAAERQIIQLQASAS